MIPVYVLYCEEFVSRTTACRAHLKEMGIPATFWRGFAGKEWGLATTWEYDSGKTITPGHVGLNAGFWALCQHIYLSLPVGDDSFIIFEDDVRVPSDFQVVMEDLQDELARVVPDWGLVFLGMAETEPHVWGKVTERLGRPDSRLCRLNEPFGTHALMMRRKTLTIILDRMAVAERHLDQQLWSRVLQTGLLSWCAVLPSLVTQRTFDYTGTGKPEWIASTVDPAAPVNGLTATEAVALVESKGKPSAERLAATAALTDPYPCIFRGEWTDDAGEYSDANGRRKTVPLAECARLNTPCHTKPNVESPGAISCQRCQLRSEMAASKVRDRLSLPEGHFNPSMIVYNGKLIMATRDSWGHSKVALWEMRNTEPDWTGEWCPTAIGSYASANKDAPRLEDPRLFLAPSVTGHPQLCCVFSLPDGYPPKRVQVGYVRFASDLSGITETNIYRSPYQSAYEKNWVPFADEDGLHWVYGSKPDHLVLGESQNWSTENPLPWTGGVIRGGACPVRVEPGEFSGLLTGERPSPVYYHFFHGAMKRLEGTVYTVGCAVFEPRAPYKITRQTAVPLIWPDLPGPDEAVVKRYVVWPGGAVPHAGAWHLALGIDDTNCRIHRIPFDKVEEALNDVPETDAAWSLRHTPLAAGTRGE